ncbi:MAG: hypothetical protein ACP5RJ_06405 [Conexivisphaera sp.]
MSSGNTMGSAAPVVGPAPTGAESGAVGSSEMIEKLLGAFSGRLEDFLWHGEIKVLSIERNRIWYRVSWENSYYFEEFLNWVLMCLRAYGAYRNVYINIRDSSGPYVIHIGLPKEGEA